MCLVRRFEKRVTSPDFTEKKKEGDFARSRASWAVKAWDVNPWIAQPLSVQLEFSSRFKAIRIIQFRLYNLNLVYKFNYKILWFPGSDMVGCIYNPNGPRNRIV